MKEILSILAILCSTAANAQTLSLDSCRAMALRNNKQLAVGKVQKDIAFNVRKAARTKYLPKVTAMGGYELMSKEISLLSNAQKTTLNNLGTTMMQGVSGDLTSLVTGMVQNGTLSPAAAQQVSQVMTTKGAELAQTGNNVGQAVTDAFRTNTRNIFAGTIMVTQPLFMGGAITALNNLADLQEQFAGHTLEKQTDETLYAIDHIYWLIVSLKHKQQLAKSFNTLVSKLNSDVQKMIKEGVATKADGLKVAVKLNESEMALTQAEDGISLAKMLLCQQCGMPLESDITLADEDTENLAVAETPDASDAKGAIEQRAETKLLETAVDMTKEATHLVKAEYLPQVLLTGGYLVTNPNVYNSFENKFSGVWNIGVMFRMPIWNWFETTYKVRASKSATVLAEYELADAKEKMELQVNQEKFKVSEANKRLAMAQKNIASAEENLRCANIGFKEGVISSTDVIGAQTAWFEAQSHKIDAEIEVRMSQLGLKKALGRMN